MKKDFEKIRFYFFLAILIAATGAFFVVVRPFVYPIFWAAVLAWLFFPLYKKLHEHLIPHKSIASLVSVTFVVLIFLVPLVALLSIVVQQSIVLYVYSEQEIGNFLVRWRSLISRFDDFAVVRLFEASGIDWQAKIVDTIRALSEYVFSGIRGFTSGTIRVVIGFFVMLYALYYFFKDGESILRKTLRLSPLDDKSERVIYDKFTSVIRATLRGTLLVALVQGILAGMVFWIAGIIAPVFWGLVMTVLALIPSIGPALLAFPAAIILLVTGKIWEGIFVLVFGVVFISLVDNLLRPYLVGRDIHMHPLLIFFSTIGGLVVFGISGFIIGPIIASIFISVWLIYEKHYKKQLDGNRK